MLRASSVLILEPEGPPLYERGEPCAGCTVVLQGRLSTRVACGSETFEGERGPWSILGAQALAQEVYVADFAVDVLEPTRVLQLARETYEVVCKAARQEAEATHSLARAAAPPSPSAAAATAWVDEAAAGRDAGQDAGQDAGGRSALTPSASSAGGPSLQPNPFFSGSSSSELARPPAGGIAIEMMGALPPASEDAAV
uniref:Cyclic nucleotide-binding domain-containing protein n=2 Tax=Emiliania huxleyi TaxID=2903 RepID=A0A7S3WCN9_EMIHU